MRVHLVPRRLGGVVLTAAGCSSWQVTEVAPAELLQDEHPERLRITRGDSSRVILDHPRLAGDSLAGDTAGTSVAIPLGDVQALAIRKGDAAKTVGLVAGLSVAGLIFAASAMDDCCGPSSLSVSGR